VTGVFWAAFWLGIRIVLWSALIMWLVYLAGH
jgi:hypothetical protein